MNAQEKVRKLEVRRQWEREQITVPKYTITTPNRQYMSSGVNWRAILQMLKSFGYEIPLSACRDLWHGKKIVEFNGIKIEDMFYTFNG